MAWFNTNYLRKKQIIIDHTKVIGGVDLVSFPALISRVDTDLKTVANGGKVQNSSGFDIIFTNATETTKLDHEIDHYVGSTGEIEMWVRIPTLSHTVDTVIYMYYDNSTISTSQENKTGVWDSSYKGVYHFGDGTTLSVADSTSNANNGTNNSATAAAGQIDGGASLNGSSSFIGLPSTILPSGAGAWTASIWWLVPSTSPTTWQEIFHIGTFNGAAGAGVRVAYDGSSFRVDNAAFSFTVHGGSIVGSGVYHVIATYDGTNIALYVNGVLIGSAALALSIVDSVAQIGLDEFGNHMSGVVDEARLSSSIARSSGWDTTEYNSQSSPSTFYSVGAAQSRNLRISDGYGGVFS